MLSQTWLIFRQQLRLSFREPIWYLIGLIQPLIYLGLFAPLLRPLADMPALVENLMEFDRLAKAT